MTAQTAFAFEPASDDGDTLTDAVVLHGWPAPLACDAGDDRYCAHCNGNGRFLTCAACPTGTVSVILEARP